MSDLLKIAAILFENLSDAFLQSASEISKLPKSQKSLVKRLTYKSGDAVIVLQGEPPSRLKCRILKRIADTEYLVYPQGQLKSLARAVNHAQILGFDPDR